MFVSFGDKIVNLDMTSVVEVKRTAMFFEVPGTPGEMWRPAGPGGLGSNKEADIYSALSKVREGIIMGIRLGHKFMDLDELYEE